MLNGGFDLGRFIVEKTCDRLRKNYKDKGISVPEGMLTPIEPRLERHAWNFYVPFHKGYNVLVFDSEQVINVYINGDGIKEGNILQRMKLVDAENLRIEENHRKYLGRICVGVEGRSLMLEVCPTILERKKKSKKEEGLYGKAFYDGFNVTSENAEEFCNVFYCAVMKPAFAVLSGSDTK